MPGSHLGLGPERHCFLVGVLGLGCCGAVGGVKVVLVWLAVFVVLCCCLFGVEAVACVVLVVVSVLFVGDVL